MAVKTLFVATCSICGESHEGTTWQQLHDKGWHSIGLELRCRFPDGDREHDRADSLEFCPLCSKKMGYFDDPFNDAVVANIREALRSSLKAPLAINA